MMKKTTYPFAMFIIDFDRESEKNILIIFLPILIALTLSFFSTCVPFVYGKPFVFGASLSTLAITILVAYRFIIQSMMPQVGYLTIADEIYILIFLAAFFPLLLQMTGWFLITKRKGVSDERGKELVSNFNLISTLSMIPLCIIIVIYFYIIL